jgi:tetratricopeptide (TPR) repeat protein
MNRALLLAILLAAGAARANVWQHAARGDQPDPAYQRYEFAMREGDEAVTRALDRSASAPAIEVRLRKAEKAYRAAAAAEPKDGEPYYRIGQMLDEFFVDCDPRISHPPTCDPSNKNLAIERRIVDAWDAFEAREPLDPRILALLPDRAIKRTKLVETAKDPRPLLEAAMRDYEAFLDRYDGLAAQYSSLALVWGNLAETYMMLDRLDEAIPAYREAIRRGGTIETVYGLAVALDRDDRGLQAKDLIVDHGLAQFRTYRQAYQAGSVFYVPNGEQYYYFALAQEAFGDNAAAAANWRLFLRSGAHPEYQPRAREHLAALAKVPRVSPRDLPSPAELMP